MLRQSAKSFYTHAQQSTHAHTNLAQAIEADATSVDMTLNLGTAAYMVLAQPATSSVLPPIPTQQLNPQLIVQVLNQKIN